MLIVAVLLAIGGPLGGALSRTIPSLSPLIFLSSVLAQRRWFAGVVWPLAPLVLLGMAFWKGRWFCRWLCPAGTLYSLPTVVGAKKTIFKWRLGAVIFWIIVFGAAAGAPLLGFLDPLSTFHRLSPLWTGAYSAASIVFGLLLPVMLIASAIQPMIWCVHFCPLGYGFDLCRSLCRVSAKTTFSRSRRGILAGLVIGLPAAVIARKFLFVAGHNASLPILPPGAKDPETFAAACTRCYACLNVCPTRILRVSFPAGRAIGQAFQPEVKYFSSREQPNHGFCAEYCNQCSRVCPSGALSPLSFDQKYRRQIGTAEVLRPACLAWTDGESCMVCQEHCPYVAIETDTSAEGIPRPVVQEDLCRGCGVCQNKCPAERAGKAIVVGGVKRQRQLAAAAETIIVE